VGLVRPNFFGDKIPSEGPPTEFWLAHWRGWLLGWDLGWELPFATGACVRGNDWVWVMRAIRREKSHVGALWQFVGLIMGRPVSAALRGLAETHIYIEKC